MLADQFRGNGQHCAYILRLFVDKSRKFDNILIHARILFDFIMLFYTCPYMAYQAIFDLNVGLVLIIYINE